MSDDNKQVGGTVLSIREALQLMVDRFSPCREDYVFSKRMAIDKAESALGASDAQASTIAALKEQLASAFEQAAQACEDERVEDTGSEGDIAYNNAIKHAAAAIRALASQPAAPVQPLSIEAIRKLALDMCATDAEGHSEDFNNGRAYGVAKMNAALMKLAAPPVQQPGDVREDILGAVARGWCAPENANKVMDEKLAFAIAREVQALATTRPSAALTEVLATLTKSQWTGVDSYGDACCPVCRSDEKHGHEPECCIGSAILAASSGALAVPEGYAIVPVEPTDDMKDAPEVKVGGCYSCSAQQVSWGECAEIYRAMISAAPAIPAQGQTK